jgi:hypothetical protein
VNHLVDALMLAFSLWTAISGFLASVKYARRLGWI